MLLIAHQLFTGSAMIQKWHLKNVQKNLKKLLTLSRNFETVAAHTVTK